MKQLFGKFACLMLLVMACCVVAPVSALSLIHIQMCIRDSLSDMAKENNITKTALIVVGDVLGSDYELSKLYDKNFKTEYRK